MIELEKLYDCVEEHRAEGPLDWHRLATQFAGVFRAKMVFYQTRFDDDGRLVAGIELIATSDPDLMRDYIGRKIYEVHPISEASLAPLEPVRRTDAMDDKNFCKLGPLSDFLISNGMFDLMIVPAVMPYGSFDSLYVWRDAGEQDYSDLENQRFTLLMRHLLAIVGSQQLTPCKPDRDILAFD